MDNSIENMKKIIKEDYDRKVKKFGEIHDTGKVIIIGDSMVAYLNLNQYGLKDVINQGIAGDTTPGVIKRLDMVTRLKPSIVILNIGSNDIVLTELSYLETVDHIIKIKEDIESKTYALVYVMNLTPVLRDHEITNATYVSHRTNKDILKINNELKKRLHKEDHINIFDKLIDSDGNLDTRYTTDGIHLNHLGYEIYTHLIHEIIKH
jgi:lysophospholipase L1-like esterase